MTIEQRIDEAIHELIADAFLYNGKPSRLCREKHERELKSIFYKAVKKLEEAAKLDLHIQQKKRQLKELEAKTTPVRRPPKAPCKPKPKPKPKPLKPLKPLKPPSHPDLLP